MGRHIGDMNPDPSPITLAPGRDRIIEISGAGRVDGEGGELGQVAAGAAPLWAPLAARFSLELKGGPKAAAAKALGKQRLKRLAGRLGVRDPLGLNREPGGPRLRRPVPAPRLAWSGGYRAT